MATTYNNLYLDIRRQLKAADIPAAQLEAREIVCVAAEKTLEEFYRDMSLYMSDQVEEKARELAARRLAGEPVAYIVGEWEFYGLTLDVTPDVLIPRIDTEVLAEQAILRARAAGEGCRVLDLCTGSGCVGLAIAANAPESKVVLADISEAALKVCKGNIRRTGLVAQTAAVQADARMSPLPAFCHYFDVIACNPPYIRRDEMPRLDPSVRDYEPHLALEGGEDGLDFYRAVVTRWKEALKMGGTLLFEVGAGQAPAVEKLLMENGYQIIDSYQDTQGIWRVVSGTLQETM